MEPVRLVLMSLFSALTLFIIAKVIGHKQMSQLDFFDYITGITIGSIAAELATELEEPWKPFIAMVVYGSITVVLALVTAKFPKSRKYINGTPTVIFSDGKLYRKNLKKAKLDLSEFMVMCRQEGYFHLKDIQMAVFEYNGRLTVLPKSEQRPATPRDLGLQPQKEGVETEIIMDGRILQENLKRKGLNLTWLEKQLEQQGVKHAKDVFLGLCDDQNQLTIYKME